MSVHRPDKPGASFHEFEHRGWRRAAVAYRDYWQALTAQAIEPLLDGLQVSRGVRLLDLACGPGALAAAAARRKARPLGVDFAEEMIALARRRLPNLEFQVADAERLPLANALYDAVAINFGMLHFARPERALREAFRVLVPGGRVGFTVWAEPKVARAFGIVYAAIGRHGTLDVALPEGPPFFRFSAAGEARRILREAGFARVKVQQVPMTWRLPSRVAFLEAFERGTARTGPILRAQAPAARREIRRTIREALKAYARPQGGLALPMASVLAIAVKPSTPR